MSIADAGVKEQMPDDAPEVGAKLKANMAQPVRKGVAKWTDTVSKLTVREPTPPRGMPERAARVIIAWAGLTPRAARGAGGRGGRGARDAVE